MISGTAAHPRFASTKAVNTRKGPNPQTNAAPPLAPGTSFSSGSIQQQAADHSRKTRMPIRLATTHPAVTASFHTGSEKMADFIVVAAWGGEAGKPRELQQGGGQGEGEQGLSTHV